MEKFVESDKEKHDSKRCPDKSSHDHHDGHGNRSLRVPISSRSECLHHGYNQSKAEKDPGKETDHPVLSDVDHVESMAHLTRAVKSCILAP